MKFEISPSDYKQINEFIKEQDKLSGCRYGAIGGAYTYSFTPTSLGIITTIKNSFTGKELDFTDYDSW